MCTLLVLSLPFMAGAVDDDSLVLYLPFDEGSGQEVKDMSGTGNDGTIEGDVDWIQDGKIGSALAFNEIDQAGVVIVKPSESLAIEENLTVEVWVNPNSVGDYRNVLGQATPFTYFLSIHQENRRCGLELTGAGGQTWVGTADPIPLNEWIHVASVWDSGAGEIWLYINGELNATRPK